MNSIASVAALYATSQPDISSSLVGDAVRGAGYGAMTVDKADAVSKDFESMFVSQMLEQMFGDSSGEEAFGGSETNDVYKGLLMDQYGKLIARAGGIGIAPYVKQELLKQQEVAA